MRKLLFYFAKYLFISPLPHKLGLVWFTIKDIFVLEYNDPPPIAMPKKL